MFLKFSKFKTMFLIGVSYKPYCVYSLVHQLPLSQLGLSKSGQWPHRGVVVTGVERVQFGEEVDDEHLQEEERY